MAYDIIIVGHGAAALAAAVSATETNPEAKVLVLERTAEKDRGGNTRWTSSFMRAEEPGKLADGFEADFSRFSDGQSDPAYVRALAQNAPETLQWVEQLGVAFSLMPMFFITTSKPRLGVNGGGAEVLNVLERVAKSAGVEFRYEHTAVQLLQDDSGAVTGVVAELKSSERVEFFSGAVLIASGGFQGNPQMMAQYLGEDLSDLPTVARGGQFNRGEGIQMAIGAGGDLAGELSGYHCEPVDPRSNVAEAINMAYSYGILLNGHGERFVDEASGTVDETYEMVTREIARQPGHLAYLLADQNFYRVDGWQRAVLTDRKPYSADTLEELAVKLGVEADALVAAVQAYNEAARGNDWADLDPQVPDGLGTEPGYAPAKSNWALPLDQPPFVAWPLTAAVVFTFGGIRVNEKAEVIRPDGTAIAGLYAAGEVTGVYYGKYPGATSVMRALTFGRQVGLQVGSMSQAGLRVGTGSRDV